MFVATEIYLMKGVRTEAEHRIIPIAPQEDVRRSKRCGEPGPVAEISAQSDRLQPLLLHGGADAVLRAPLSADAGAAAILHCEAID